MSGTITKLPDLAASFAKMALADKLSGIQGTTQLHVMIQNFALDRPDECFRFIKSAAEDNRKAIIDVIGEELLLKVERI